MHRDDVLPTLRLQASGTATHPDHKGRFCSSDYATVNLACGRPAYTAASNVIRCRANERLSCSLPPRITRWAAEYARRSYAQKVHGCVIHDARPSRVSRAWAGVVRLEARSGGTSSRCIMPPPPPEPTG